MSQKVKFTAGIIIIGNEILSGRTSEKNIQFLALELNKIGISLTEARVIPDIEEEIINTVNAMRKKFDYVFTTGGIGPTHDDITSLSVAKAFNLEHKRNPMAEQILRSYYKKNEITAARLKMADLPESAELLLNPVSKAPGFKVENVYVLPGVPKILKAMFNGFSHTLVGGQPTLSRSGCTHLGEGVIGDSLRILQSRYKEVQIGSYPFSQNGNTGTCIVVRHIEKKKLDSVFHELTNLIRDLGGTLNIGT